MIVLAPQLSDWGETSARQAISLVRYFQKEYGIDPEHTFIEGYSGGGETLSLILGIEPGLFARALVCSTQWDGDLEVLAAAKVPVLMVIGESDEYYTSEPLQRAYEGLRAIYASEGLSEQEIGDLVRLEVMDGAYFAESGVVNQHGGGAKLFAHDPQIMGWLLDG